MEGLTEQKKKSRADTAADFDALYNSAKLQDLKADTAKAEAALAAHAWGSGNGTVAGLVWACGRVGVWACGCVGVWVCGLSLAAKW